MCEKESCSKSSCHKVAVKFDCLVLSAQLFWPKVSNHVLSSSQWLFCSLHPADAVCNQQKSAIKNLSCNKDWKPKCIKVNTYNQLGSTHPNPVTVAICFVEKRDPLLKKNPGGYSYWVGGRSRNQHMGVSLNGGTPKTPQNDHF